MFNKKFFISLFLTFLLALGCFSATIFASDGSINDDNIKILIDGKCLNFKEPPVEIDGRTLVPLRDIFEALGATLEWDDSTSTVTGTKGSQKVVLQIDNPTAYINDSPVTLSVPGTLVNEKTMVPTRFIAESMNCVVSWNEATKTVIIVPNKTIIFRDKNLENAVKEALKTDKANLEVADIVSLRRLSVRDKKITSLDGLQYLINLESLNLNSNQISDISILSGLIQLEYLDLSNNSISNIEPLSKLENLCDLYLDSNKIDNIKPLGSLLKLDELTLSKNKISNIEILKNLTGLKFLNLYSTLTEDITPISSLKDLSVLNISYTQVTDISPLKDSESLKNLSIVGDAVIDMLPIKNIKSLDTLYFDGPEKTEINEDFFGKNSILKSRAKSIIDKIIKPGMSDLDKELAIHDYIILNCKYDSEGYVNGTVSNDAHTPYGVLVNGVGVCDGYASSMKALLNMVNIKAYTVIGKSLSLSSTPMGHAWNIVTIEGKNYYLDATYDDRDAKDGINRLSHNYFNISAKQISADHKFDREFYPVADTDNADFDRLNDVFHYMVINNDYTYTCTNGYLYKIDNKTQTATKIYTDEVYELAYNNGWIYYINHSNGDKIYKIKTDGTDNTKLSENPAVHIYIKDSYIYYLDRDPYIHKLHRMDLDGKNTKNLNSDTLTTTLYLSDDRLFYKIFSFGNGSKFYSVDLNGDNKSNIIDASLTGFKELTGKTQFTYYPSEILKNNYIYYINADDKNSLYRIRENGTGKQQLSKNTLESESYYFHIIGDWIYYVNNSDKQIYKVKTDGSQESIVEH